MSLQISKKNIIDLVPKELREILFFKQVEDVSSGFTDSVVLKFIKGFKNKNVYLKMLKNNLIERLETESKILEWLRGQLPVPELIFYSSHRNYEFMLISEIKGLPLHDTKVMAMPEVLIAEMVKALKMIHSLDIRGCEFNQQLDAKFEIAKRNLEHNRIRQDEFHREYQTMTPEDIYNFCVSNKSAEKELVFTHGDYCLTNIYLDNNSLSGVIDWGRAGVADRYQDIALAIRSLTDNFKFENFHNKWIDLFLDMYGEDNPDWNKIHYYNMLDELVGPWIRI